MLQCVCKSDIVIWYTVARTAGLFIFTTASRMIIAMHAGSFPTGHEVALVRKRRGKLNVKLQLRINKASYEAAVGTGRRDI